MNEKINEIIKSILDNLTDEQKEKAKKCKTMDELMAFAGQEGLELPDEARDNVNGGCVSCDLCSENDPYWTCEEYNDCPRDYGDLQCAHIY